MWSTPIYDSVIYSIVDEILSHRLSYLYWIRQKSFFFHLVARLTFQTSSSAPLISVRLFISLALNDIREVVFVLVACCYISTAITSKFDLYALYNFDYGIVTHISEWSSNKSQMQFVISIRFSISLPAKFDFFHIRTLVLYTIHFTFEISYLEHNHYQFILTPTLRSLHQQPQALNNKTKN